MSENKVLTITATIAGLILIVPVVGYVLMYGSNPVYSHEKWAQFGDFFGGVLNPLYAFLAFLALLYTINLQRTELKQVRSEFRRSADAAQQQIDHLKLAAKQEDLIRIIRLIDQEIGQLRQTLVSEPGTQPAITVDHIAHEVYRQSTGQAPTGAFAKFLDVARTPGTVVEALYTQLTTAISELSSYLQELETVSDSQTSVVQYFKRKNERVVGLARSAGGVDQHVLSYLQAR
ncbi:hypothetical protein [Marinobacter nauticus]|uniref:hypothetical protein n=1 Tax=Marinobacter nauticus TaxID=2743 RepID=UPI000EB03D55|nr:hypothetical protein [Marinobacter nauticus]RKR70981.1 hypothetical protein C7436_3466 [Marinobacter nauticus]